MSGIIREERIGPHRLILGDCLEVMPTLGPVDAVVTDPPYGIGETGSNSRQKDGISRLGTKTRVVNYAAKSWDNTPASPEHINTIRDLSKHQIIFGGNYFDGLGPTSCWLVWDKQNTGDFADCELAWTNLPKAVRRVYWRWNGMIRKGGDVRQHPTQKPVGVMEWCINHLPADTRTILDPFAGSGTTGVACVKTGHAFTGIERDPEYFQIMCDRIDEAIRQPADMFYAPPEAPKQEEIDL